MTNSIQAIIIKNILKYTLRRKYKSIKQLRSQSIGSPELLSRYFPNISYTQYRSFGIDTAILKPDSEKTEKAVLFLHGGGYVTGGIKSHLLLGLTLSDTLHAALFLPEYRLAPEYPFPAALDDARQTYNWILEQGFKPGSISIIGDSAGGGLALALIQSLLESGEKIPSAVVCISPWTDLTLSGNSLTHMSGGEIVLRADELSDWANYYSNMEKLENPKVSPLFGSFAGFPKLLIQVGSDEMLLDDSNRLNQK
ncbi:MAG: alpha/beta hydrolase, partial [Chloroflexota bacterium]